MADLDDDFGDIYTDVVEAHPTSAINGVSNFTQFYTQPQNHQEEEEDDDDSDEKVETCSDSEKPNSNPEDLGRKVSGSEDCYSDSDSEDDLNIVLNDEGCKGIPFPIISGGGSLRPDDYQDEDEDALVAVKDCKYVWTQGSTCPSNGKPPESVDSMHFGGDHSQTSRVHDTSNQVVTRNRFGFRLPWYRTILDVDIESFEEKSWRYPGVDITDYFNFDLNEDSWKEYCHSLEQLRQLKSMRYGMPCSSRFYQAKGAGSECGRFDQETMFKETNYVGSTTFAPPSSTVSDCRPKGKAIQIEDSIVERQPSFDERHPCSWDSDVVIQISVQDPTKEASNSCGEHDDTDSRAHETSENGEFDVIGNRNNISCSTTDDDDSSLGSPEANTRKLGRCSQKISAFHPMTKDSDDHRNNQHMHVDGNNHKEANGISLEATEISNEVTESLDRNTSCADQCMMETLVSLSDDDDDQLSLISTCFSSDSEASKNKVNFDAEDMHTPVRAVVNSHTEPHKSVTSPFKNSEGNCIKRKRADIQDHPICRISSQKKYQHQAMMLSSIEELCNDRNKDNDRPPISDTKHLHNRRCSEDFHRQKDRLRCSGSNIDDISDYREPKFSSLSGIRYADNHDRNQRDKRNHSNRNGSHQLREKVDPYAKRTLNERQTFCEDKDTDWSQFGRSQFTEEKSHLPTRESRGLHSRYSSTIKERGAQWRRNSNRLLFKKLANYKWHEDDFLGERAGRCSSFTGRRRNNCDEFDERQLIPAERELSHWGRRGEYMDSPIYLDDSHSELFEDEYYPRTTDERCWRHARRIDVEEANDISWFDDHYDAYETDSMHPHDHIRWRRSNWRSEVMHWTEDQLTLQHHGEKLYSEKASLSYRKYVRCGKFHGKYGPLHGGMPINDMHPEQHRLGMPRKGIGANFINKSAKMYRGKHEQTMRCRDSTDLAVRDQKTSARCSNARISTCNGRPDISVNLQSCKSEKATPDISANLQSCKSEKARAVDITQKVEWDQNNEKGHGKFPVAAQNADFDIEEGQIVTQEQNTAAHPSQRKHGLDHTAPAQIVKKRIFNCHNASIGNKVVERYDKERILQTMAKMEQRGERFKEPITFKKEQHGEHFKGPITLKMEPEKSFKPEVDPTVETADEKQHRPARKRRWGGRFPKNDSLMLGIPLTARF